MSSDTIALTLGERKVVGKQVRALRREGRVPAVIHNHGKDSIIVDAPFIEITKVYEKAGKHHPVDLTVGKDKYLAIIRDVDLDPRKNDLRHVVFNAVRQNEKVQTEVPLRFEGDSEAEKSGLMLLHHLENIEIEATPRNLPDEIVVNVEKLAEVGDKIIVGDVKAPENVEFITDAEHPIVAVIETPAQQSEESETDESAEQTEAGEETPEQGKSTEDDA